MHCVDLIDFRSTHLENTQGPNSFTFGGITSSLAVRRKGL